MNTGEFVRKEISSARIAETKFEFDRTSAESEFFEDWKMTNLLNIAIMEIGE